MDFKILTRERMFTKIMPPKQGLNSIILYICLLSVQAELFLMRSAHPDQTTLRKVEAVHGKQVGRPRNMEQNRYSIMERTLFSNCIWYFMHIMYAYSWL